MTMQFHTDHRSECLPVRDQGRRPTCLAHSLSTAHEHELRAERPLSPEYLHFFASGGVPAHGCLVPLAIDALERHGQTFETDCPYQPDTPPVDWLPPSDKTAFRRTSSTGPKDSSAIVEQLGVGRLPVLIIDLPRGFFRPRPPWVIQSDGESEGLHSVVAVGSATGPEGSVLLIRNSWGQNWADGGYAYLDEEYLRRHLVDVIILGGAPKI